MFQEPVIDIGLPPSVGPEHASAVAPVDLAAAPTLHPHAGVVEQAGHAERPSARHSSQLSSKLGGP